MKRFAESLLWHRAAAARGLCVKQFDQWHPELDEALRTLPEDENCTHELFRLLMRNGGASHKSIMLVKEKEEPVALAGLRHREDHLEPVTTWILPGVLFPTKEGYVERVLPALSVNLFIAWWRQEASPPENRQITDHKCSPTYKMDCSDDFESYWKKSGHLNTVRRMRNRCRDFELEINPPGASEWTVRNWGKHWNVPSDEVEDRVIAANYLESKGHHFTLVLRDKEVWVAGHTFLSHHNDAVWQVTCRNPGYDSYGVGTRLMDLAFQWASEEGFDKIDLGGDHEYKARWAPKEGVKHSFRVSPSYPSLVQEGYQLVRKIKRKLHKGLGRRNLVSTEDNVERQIEPGRS